MISPPQSSDASTISISFRNISTAPSSTTTMTEGFVGFGSQWHGESCPNRTSARQMISSMDSTTERAYEGVVDGTLPLEEGMNVLERVIDDIQDDGPCGKSLVEHLLEDDDLRNDTINLLDELQRRYSSLYNRLLQHQLADVQAVRRKVETAEEKLKVIQAAGKGPDEADNTLSERVIDWWTMTGIYGTLKETLQNHKLPPDPQLLMNVDVAASNLDTAAEELLQAMNNESDENSYTDSIEHTTATSGKVLQYIPKADFRSGSDHGCSAL